MRKETPTMCPTFIVTGEEIMSTRGRANTIRAALEMRGVRNGIVKKPGSRSSTEQLPFLQASLRSAFQCKPCAAESRVVARAHSAARAIIARTAVQFRRFSGENGCLLPSLANQALQSILVRSLLTKTVGIAWQRPLPHFARQRFDRWFARRARSPAGFARAGDPLG